MCLDIHRKRARIVVARESTITECWSQETELDQQGVEIQRTRTRDRGEVREGEDGVGAE